MPIQPSFSELFPGGNVSSEKVEEILRQAIKRIHVSDLLRTVVKTKNRSKRSAVVSDYLNVAFASVKDELPQTL